jgi:hypothetical protein
MPRQAGTRTGHTFGRAVWAGQAPHINLAVYGCDHDGNTTTCAFEDTAAVGAAINLRHRQPPQVRACSGRGFSFWARRTFRDRRA